MEHMQNLFSFSDPLCNTLCEVIQLLLTSDLYDAKYIWLTKICGLSPTNGILNSFGTDKQFIMYPLRNIFSRSYQFASCSSEHCPLDKSILLNDNFSDVTLHSPDAKTENSTCISQSIKEWEQGISSKAAISCKGEFVDEPTHHKDFISESYKNKQIIRCSGWKKPINIKFVSPPPFLLFDISSLFREQLSELSSIPHEIIVYGESYKLGGVTSYVTNRTHYVGYISLNENDFLFYDGLPSSKPVLRKYQDKTIEGDLSLLCYFPLNNLNVSTKILSKDGVENVSNHKKIQIETTNLNNNDVCNGIVPDTTNDFLLARALEQIETETENIYEKPRGKSYRTNKTETMADRCNVIKTKCGKLLAEEDVDLIDSMSSSSISSLDDARVEFEINSEIIEFINRKKDFILQLVSDRSCSSPNHIRSERLVTLHSGASLREFEGNGIIEYRLICQKLAPFIGASFEPYAPYTDHISSQILKEKRNANPDDIFDFGGYFPIPINIRTLPDRYKTIDLVILPEIFTEFIMSKNDLDYKKASQYFYSEGLPTTHHTQMLLNDKNVIFNIEIPFNKKNITLQIVEGEIDLQRTHAIINTPNRQVESCNDVLIKQGGSLIKEQINNYIKINDIANTGDVIVVSPGKLECYHLFHAIPPEWVLDQPEEHLFKKIFSNLLLQLDKYHCKSVSMPSFNCEQLPKHSLRKNITTITTTLFETLSGELNKELSVIRIVSSDKRVLETFIGVIKSIRKPIDSNPKGKKKKRI